MAITLAIQKSPLNVVQFVPDPEQYPINPAYNTIHEGQSWHINTLQFGVYKTNYYYKMQLGDPPIDLQFHITANNGLTATIELIDATKKIYWSWGPTVTLTLTNNTYVVDGVTRQMATFHFRIPPGDVLTRFGMGVYYLRLKVNYSRNSNGNLDTTVYEYSEPISIRPVHLNTILLAISNNTNDYDTIFLQTSAKFAARMEGALHHAAYDSVDTAFVGSRNSPKKLYGYPGTMYSLTVGGGKGVPEWVKRWANYAVVCDHKAVNGREISKDQSSSKWEMITADPAYPLGAMTISVRLADPSLPYINILRPPIVLITRPATGFPYFVHTVAIRNTGGFGGAIPPVTLGTGYYITGPAAEQLMMQRLNAGVASNNVDGYVTWVGNELRFYNNGLQIYDTNASVVLPLYATVTYDTAISATVSSLSMSASYSAIVWNATDYTLVGSKGNVVGGSFGHTYAAGSGKVTALVFHDDGIQQLISFSDNNVSAFGGTVSRTMFQLTLRAANLVSFDFAVLRPAAAALQGIDLTGSQLSSLVNVTALSDTFGTFRALKALYLPFNHLPVPQVNALLQAADTMVTASLVTAGTLGTRPQVPVGPPSGAGITAKNDMHNNYGWTVDTD